MSQVSFKQRVCNEIISCAKGYKAVFLDYDYLIFSSGFVVQPYYILSAIEGNYKHLTGVNSNIAPHDFYMMCLNGTISENDFDFIKPRESEKSVKGAVRNKIIALPLMMKVFMSSLIADENFSHGKVSCALATTDNSVTVGFDNRITSRPKTLLRGNEISNPRAVRVDLVLKRVRSSAKFNIIVQGEAREFWLNSNCRNLPFVDKVLIWDR